MILDIDDIFPENVSDETAFYVVEFMLNLSQMMESHFYKKTKRYFDDCRSSEEPEFLTRKKDIDDSF